MDRASVAKLRSIVERIEKCCAALERKLNLADVLHDDVNYHAITKTFGQDDLDVGVQLLLKVALEGYETTSFTLHSEIQGQKKTQFIYRFVGAWKQFDTVVAVTYPRGQGRRPVELINPLKQQHWGALESLPAGTLVTVFLKTAQGKRSQSQERLALDRFKAVFETVQNRAAQLDAQPAPVVQLERKGSPHARQTARPSTSTAKRPVSSAKRAPLPSIRSGFKNHAPTGGTTPVLSFKVVINKMDTFVHAGNAQLILGHLREYQGRVQLFVLRGEKKSVQLDADSIWGAEIRNGETVLFEFFGPNPPDEFVKELAKKVNKYTQMDKLAHE